MCGGGGEGFLFVCLFFVVFFGGGEGNFLYDIV